jgi:hypothetical protein
MTHKTIALALATVLCLAASCQRVTSQPDTANQIIKNTPEQNERVEWSTYNANEYFTFDYPTDWFVEECGLMGVVIGNGEIGSPGCGWAGPALPPAHSNIGNDGSITIDLHDLSGDESSNIQSETRDFERHHKILSEKATTVANAPAVELEGIREDNGWIITEVLVSYRGKLLIARNEIQYQTFRDIFYSILSSLKFTY